MKTKKNRTTAKIQFARHKLQELIEALNDARISAWGNTNSIASDLDAALKDALFLDHERNARKDDK